MDSAGALGSGAGTTSIAIGHMSSFMSGMQRFWSSCPEPLSPTKMEQQPLKQLPSCSQAIPSQRSTVPKTLQGNSVAAESGSFFCFGFGFTACSGFFIGRSVSSDSFGGVYFFYSFGASISLMGSRARGQ